MRYWESARTIAAKPVFIGVASQRSILAGELSGLLTHIVTENVSLPKKFRPPDERSFMEGF